MLLAIEDTFQHQDGERSSICVLLSSGKGITSRKLCPKNTGAEIGWGSFHQSYLQLLNDYIFFLQVLGCVVYYIFFKAFPTVYYTPPYCWRFNYWNIPNVIHTTSAIKLEVALWQTLLWQKVTLWRAYAIFQKACWSHNHNLSTLRVRSHRSQVTWGHSVQIRLLI